MLMPEGYIKVSPVLLHAEEPLKVSIFVHMPLNKKTILFLKKGDILSTEKLMELMKIPPSQVITPTAEADSAMNEFTVTMVAQLESSNTIPAEASESATKVVLSLGTVNQADPAARLAETTLILGESATLIEKIVALLKGSNAKSGFEQLRSQLKTDGNPLDTHHRHTSALAVILLLSFGEGNAAGVSELAFAAMAHDLGLRGLSEGELLLHTQGIETQALLAAESPQNSLGNLKHIEESLRLLKASGASISEIVFQVVSQHHENFDGSGPAGISGQKIIPPARILRVADDLVALLGGTTGDISGLDSAVEILKSANMKTGQARFYDPELINQIEKIITKK